MYIYIHMYVHIYMQIRMYITVFAVVPHLQRSLIAACEHNTAHTAGLVPELHQ